MNRERSQWAAVAIKAFANEVGQSDDEQEEAVHDLIADIGHYCCVNDLDFIRIVADAISCWCVERSDLSDCDIRPGPRVSILIPGRKHPMRACHQSTTTTNPHMRRRS